MYRGENVRISFIKNNAGSTQDVSQVTFYDDNNNVRALLSTERFVLTDSNFWTFPNGSTYVAYLGASSTSTGSTIPYLATSYWNNGNWITAYEGMSFPPFVTPWVFSPDASSTFLMGTGYIMQGIGWGTSPFYVAPISGPTSPVH
jgi:hypothetical protein